MTQKTVEIKVGYNEQSKGWVGESQIKLIQEFEDQTGLSELKSFVKRLADELADEVAEQSKLMTLRKQEDV